MDSTFFTLQQQQTSEVIHRARSVTLQTQSPLDEGNDKLPPLFAKTRGSDFPQLSRQFTIKPSENSATVNFSDSRLLEQMEREQNERQWRYGRENVRKQRGNSIQKAELPNPQYQADNYNSGNTVDTVNKSNERSFKKTKAVRKQDSVFVDFSNPTDAAATLKKTIHAATKTVSDSNSSKKLPAFWKQKWEETLTSKTSDLRLASAAIRKYKFHADNTKSAYGYTDGSIVDPEVLYGDGRTHVNSWVSNGTVMQERLSRMSVEASMAAPEAMKRISESARRFSVSLERSPPRANGMTIRGENEGDVSGRNIRTAPDRRRSSTMPVNINLIADMLQDDTKRRFDVELAGMGQKRLGQCPFFSDPDLSVENFAPLWSVVRKFQFPTEKEKQKLDKIHNLHPTSARKYPDVRNILQWAPMKYFNISQTVKSEKTQSHLLHNEAQKDENTWLPVRFTWNPCESDNTIIPSKISAVGKQNKTADNTTTVNTVIKGCMMPTLINRRVFKSRYGETTGKNELEVVYNEHRAKVVSRSEANKLKLVHEIEAMHSRLEKEWDVFGFKDKMIPNYKIRCGAREKLESELAYPVFLTNMDILTETVDENRPSLTRRRSNFDQTLNKKSPSNRVISLQITPEMEESSREKPSRISISKLRKSSRSSTSNRPITSNNEATISISEEVQNSYKPSISSIPISPKVIKEIFDESETVKISPKEVVESWIYSGKVFEEDSRRVSLQIQRRMSRFSVNGEENSKRCSTLISVTNPQNEVKLNLNLLLQRDTDRRNELAGLGQKKLGKCPFLSDPDILGVDKTLYGMLKKYQFPTEKERIQLMRLHAMNPASVSKYLDKRQQLQWAPNNQVNFQATIKSIVHRKVEEKTEKLKFRNAWVPVALTGAAAPANIGILQQQIRVKKKSNGVETLLEQFIPKLPNQESNSISYDHEYQLLQFVKQKHRHITHQRGIKCERKQFGFRKDDIEKELSRWLSDKQNLDVFISGRLELEPRLDYKDVLIKPKRMADNGQANMDNVGTFDMAVALASHGMVTCIHKHYTLEQWKEWGKKNPEILKSVAVSAGTSQIDLERVAKVLFEFPEIPFVCLDVANGYSEHFVEAVKTVHLAHPTHTIIAGNVVSGEMTEELILAGADIVKVGIGPGSVCTTRRQTGVGYPQLSAVLDCADAAHGLGGHVIADGGCTCPGDVAKGFGAGADYIMLGGMLAGHEESGGETIQENGLIIESGKLYKQFYGMSSSTAMNAHAGGVADYRASEGKTVKVLFRGEVGGTVREILGGVRSTCTYVGAARLKELSKRTTFIRVTQQINEVFGVAKNEQEETASSAKKLKL
ncbi:GMP reductase 2 [Physocladia obscura]|uniref:GMP reductase n=1 Tax=Physocladia obscura TaxID=109957 RepID=A0AAD5XL36_9FUNG|nr:GMP reductase 2 [Physocladia obscura]